MSLPWGDVSWCVICDCGVSSSYSVIPWYGWLLCGVALHVQPGLINIMYVLSVSFIRSCVLVCYLLLSYFLIILCYILIWIIAVWCCSLSTTRADQHNGCILCLFHEEMCVGVWSVTVVFPHHTLVSLDMDRCCVVLFFKYNQGLST